MCPTWQAGPWRGAGLAGAREACPSTRILLHIEKPECFETSDWWLSNVLARNIEFDILGQSCYPEWHGLAAGWPPTSALLATKCPDLGFLVAEYSKEKRTVNDMMWALPDGRATLSPLVKGGARSANMTSRRPLPWRPHSQ